ncbi:MAG: GNAT family N-acetyltransferase [Bacillota bacterium]|nr:GNAT family N-acetyltransferase [Bacillota bacterium]
MKITINLLKEKDAKELLQFETDNRTFFEKMVPSRGEDYYVLEAFRIRHKELLVEQDEGISRFYLIRGDNGQIVGRINLVDIDEKEFSGSIGFRIGEQYVGRGIANLALKLLLEIESGIKMIYGKTTTNNIASQKVMEKNGFKKVSVSEDEIEMNGQKLKFINYIWEETIAVYTMIIEQTKDYAKRMKYNPTDGTFFETENESLFNYRKCPYPYGWIKETGTPPNAHLDVILVSNHDYNLGDELAIKLIGVFNRADGDHKLVGIQKDSEIDDIDELTKAELDQLRNLYPHLLEDEGWYGKEKAIQIVNEFNINSGRRHG